MPPARTSLAPVRTLRLLLSAAVVLAGLVGLQVARPTVAAAAGGLTAVDDAVHLQANGYFTSATIAYLANDQASTSLDFDAFDFPDDQPGGLVPSADHRTVVFGDLGQLTLTSGRMEYSYERPGTVTARYRIADYEGHTSEALVTIVVGPGGWAVLRLRQGHSASVDVLEGDVPGNNADGTPGTIDKTSVHFTDGSGGFDSTVSADGRTLTDPGRGVFHADPATGVVTFDPEKTYRGGGGEHITYVARDTTLAADGTVQHHSYRARLDLFVTTIDPLPIDDVGATVHHASVTLAGVTNDRPGDPSVPLRPALTVFVIAGASLPDGSTLYDHGRGLKVPDQGWWTVDPAGTITFTPLAGFVGGPSPAVYLVTDAAGTTARGREQVWVTPGPAARADSATTSKNHDVVVDALGNDTAGQNADQTPGALDRTSVHFPADGQPSGAVLSHDGRRLWVPGQGIYTADATTGKVTVDPDARVVGKLGPVTYSVKDTVRRTDGRVVHNTTTSTVGVTVSAATSVARNH